MKNKIDRIKEEVKELEPFINEQLFQLLANGHTKEQAKKLVLNEIKQNVSIVEQEKKNNWTNKLYEKGGSMKKYEIKDFLSFASAFDYSDDLGIVENEKLHKEMKNWNLKKFQEFYGLTHRNDKTGQDITKK